MIFRSTYEKISRNILPLFEKYFDAPNGPSYVLLQAGRNMEARIFL